MKRLLLTTALTLALAVSASAQPQVNAKFSIEQIERTWKFLADWGLYTELCKRDQHVLAGHTFALWEKIVDSYPGVRERSEAASIEDTRRLVLKVGMAAFCDRMTAIAPLVRMMNLMAAEHAEALLRENVR